MRSRRGGVLGVRLCSGAALARMEAQEFFAWRRRSSAASLPRLRSIKPAWEPEMIATTFVGGLKRLPVRYSMTA